MSLCSITILMHALVILPRKPYNFRIILGPLLMFVVIGVVHTGTSYRSEISSLYFSTRNFYQFYVESYICTVFLLYCTLYYSARLLLLVCYFITHFCFFIFLFLCVFYVHCIGCHFGVIYDDDDKWTSWHFSLFGFQIDLYLLALCKCYYIYNVTKCRNFTFF